MHTRGQIRVLKHQRCKGRVVLDTNSRKNCVCMLPVCVNYQEARVLMNNKTEMNLDDLQEVLLENEVTNFDPVAEAFKVGDI